MTYHCMIFGFLDDVPSLLDGRSVSHKPSRDSFFRLLEFGVGKRRRMDEGRRRDVCGARCWRRPKQRDSLLGFGNVGAFRKAVDKPIQGRDIVGRPEKRPCNFRRIGQWRCFAGGQHRGRRVEINLVARKRSVDEWLLFVVGCGHHVVADVPEEEIDLKPGRLDVLEERGSVRAVAPGSISSDGAVPRRISDEHVVGRLDRRKPKHLHASHSAGSSPARLKRIVPARVQYHQSQCLGRRHCLHGRLQTDRLGTGISVIRQLYVSRQQPVVAIDLDAMAGKIENRHLGIWRHSAEFQQRAPKSIEIGVDNCFDGKS